MQAYAVNYVIDKGNNNVNIRRLPEHQVFANKEIILSAGTVATPQILMLSGIGPNEVVCK